MSSFKKKTVKDIDLKGKTVLLRADYNVPVEDGRITNDFRIKKSLPTVEYLLKQKCKIVICSHLGRPDKTNRQECSLRPVALRLGELLKKQVKFADDCIGDKEQDQIGKLENGEILLLENLRFHSGEEANDKEFAKELAKGIDVFIQDGFGVAHRAHASTDAITKFVPTSVAGLLLEEEVVSISQAMDNPKRPLMALVGGAKVSDKIDVLKRLVEIADIVAIGGGMANTFLLAQKVEIGESLAEPKEVNFAKDILEKARKKSKKSKFVFYVPQDGVVAKSASKTAKTRIVDWGTNVVADIENYPKIPSPRSSTVAEDEKILDIGPFSAAFIAGSMQLAETVIWNGAMGVTEFEALESPIGPFAHGTELVMEGMLGQFGHKPVTFVGGGDTVGYIEQRKLTEQFDHVSTGGGASLDLMSGRKLPGIETLKDK